MVTQIVILGGHIQALGLVRQAKAKGITVYLIIKDGFSVARFSRDVDRVFVCKDNQELKNLLNTIKGKDVFLFPTSDDYIDYIVQNYETLNRSFTLALPSKDIVQLFADKRLTYQFAKEKGISHPQSYYPTSESDVKMIADEVSYPVVLKPAIMFSFHKRFGKKAFLCPDKAALIERVNLIGKSFPISQLIIQEFLSGGPKQLYSYGVFAVNRIRQNPMDFGNSTTFAITCSIPEIEKTACDILHLTNYSGLAEIEFMYHNGEYRFLEVNTRAWKWHAISIGRGFGFLSNWVDYLNGKALSNGNDYSPVCWQERLTDWYIVVKEVLKGNLSLKEVLDLRKGRKVYAVWSSRDPLPAIMYVLLSPILYFKRH